jgi:hypothetical protein
VLTRSVADAITLADGRPFTGLRNTGSRPRRTASTLNRPFLPVTARYGRLIGLSVATILAAHRAVLGGFASPRGGGMQRLFQTFHRVLSLAVSTAAWARATANQWPRGR